MEITISVIISGLVVYIFMSNLAKKKDTQIQVLQALEENKIDLNDEEYPFNQTLGELNSQIKNIEERYSEYLTTKEGINTKLQDLTSLTSKLNLTLSKIIDPFIFGMEILLFSSSLFSFEVSNTSANLSKLTFNSCISCHIVESLKIGWVT